jgi:DNA-binding NtrC family response regulator
VRELENLTERLAILVDAPLVRPEDLSRLLPSGAGRHELPQPSGFRMRDLEQSEIIGALERNRWVRSWAARELGYTLRQFNYRLRKYGLEEHVADQRKRLAPEN